MTTTSNLLTEHHRDLDVAARALRACACSNDRLELINAFRRFESGIVAHMAAEDELLLDGFATQFPAFARRIRDEHEELRRRMVQLAIEVELHVIRLDQLDELIALLRDHVELEEVTMYRWANGLPIEVSRKLATRLGLGDAEAVRGPAPVEHTHYSR